MKAWLTRQPFGRLLALGFGLVGLVTVGAAVIAACQVGPGLFEAHLEQGGTTDPVIVDHAKMAFSAAGWITLAVAGGVAVLAAALVGAVVARFVARTIHAAGDTAAAIADGDFSARVADPGLGAEFAGLAASINAMAEDLEQVEATRRRTLSDLAHELRTPIAALTAYHEALADGVKPPDEAGFAVLRRHTDRLARLADDVALVTTAEEGRLTLRPVDVTVAALVEAAVAAWPGLVVAVTPEAAAAVVTADPERIGQVLTNLLDNAFRHAGADGTVTLRARWADDGVELTVTDDGDGVTAEHLPHLFDRFYRADSARDRAHGGSGIGLAIVKAIAEAHGGRVWADSDGPGRGATFGVWLPARPAA